MGWRRLTKTESLVNGTREFHHILQYLENSTQRVLARHYQTEEIKAINKQTNVNKTVKSVTLYNIQALRFLISLDC